MDQLSSECAFINFGEVVFGPGKVGTLASTGRILGASPLLYQVTSARGRRRIGELSSAVGMPTNDNSVAALLEAIYPRRNGANNA